MTEANIPASSGVRKDSGAAILPLLSVAFLRWERGEEGVVLKRKDIFYFEPSWSTPTTEQLGAINSIHSYLSGPMGAITGGYFGVWGGKGLMDCI
jgi:hypothetical protein